VFSIPVMAANSDVEVYVEYLEQPFKY